MPSTLMSRLALFVLLGAFLIPVATSSLRGLTHLLTCEGEAQTPFTLVLPRSGEPVLTTSTRIEKGQEAGVCGGLELDMGAQLRAPRQVAITVPITNHTEYPWRGTVRLELGSVNVPVRIGEIPAGGTESDTVLLSLEPGTHELAGALLVGP